MSKYRIAVNDGVETKYVDIDSIEMAVIFVNNARESDDGDKTYQLEVSEDEGITWDTWLNKEGQDVNDVVVEKYFKAIDEEEKKYGKNNKPYVREMPKIGRNDPCFCGSGRKHKRCCGK